MVVFSLPVEQRHYIVPKRSEQNDEHKLTEQRGQLVSRVYGKGTLTTFTVMLLLFTIHLWRSHGQCWTPRSGWLGIG
jgi:hypothetical protein